MILFSVLIASGQSNIYVDHQLKSDCLGRYSISSRDCSGNDGNAYQKLSGAATVASPGDTVFIRAGNYNEQLRPEQSGAPGNRITYKNFGDEEVVISGSTLSPAIWIYEIDFVTIEGLVIKNVRRWLNALGSNYIIIKKNTFENAMDAGGSSKTGLFFQKADHNRIEGNIIDSSNQDNIGMVQSNYNLIEGNVITRAKHALWALKCSNYNVIRDNYFHNGLQKIGEIYDCDGVGHGDAPYNKITSLDNTKFNVVEHNVFSYTPSPVDASPYAGIQYAGQKGIIRNNVFYECEGPPISLTLYSDEATFNYGNRIYHNVFFKNEFGGIEISGNKSHTFYDNQIKNNIFYKNKFVQRDFRWSWYMELHNQPVQLLTGRTTDINIESNNFFSKQADEIYTITYGSRTASSNPAPESLTWWEANHSSTFKNNLQIGPQFMDTTNYDFHLMSGSPMIDAGTFLTHTRTTNSGLTMEVDDASYFVDGFGIRSYSGDTIQLEDQDLKAVITKVDYASNTLYLDVPLSWTKGQKLSKSYNGHAPDIGAFEFRDNTTADDKSLNDPESEIVIFPNPTTSRLTIMGNEIGRIKVLDLQGRTLSIERLDRDVNEKIVELNDYSIGTYLIEVTTSKGTAVSRIVKQ